MTYENKKWPTVFARLVKDRPTFVDIAEKAGVDPSFVSKVAAGSRRPSAKVRDAASAVLGVPAKDIFPEWESD